MCGLCGVYSTSWGVLETDYFKHLLMLNVFRGEHSTGVIRVGKDKKTKTRKTLLASPQFLGSQASDILESEKNDYPLALLGHTRHATKGEIILKNAHPFGFSDVVGMHNGTVHTSFKHKSEYGTDSEALYKNLNDYGLEATLNDIEAYDTAYALQWINKREGTLNFIKNSARPLYFTFIYAGTTMLWSSEKRMLQFVLDSKKYSGNQGWRGDTSDKFFTLKEHDHLSLKLGLAPKDGLQINPVSVKKKYGPSTTQATTKGRSTGNSTSSAGPRAWIQDAGGVYRLVTLEEELAIRKEKLQIEKEKATRLGQNSSPSPRKTSPSTDDTSGGTRGSPTTSTALTVLPGSDTNNGGGLGDSYRSFRDKFGKDLQTLPWLGSPSLPHSSKSSDTSPSSPLADLFDKNFAEERVEGESDGGSGEVSRTDVAPWEDPNETHFIKAGKGLSLAESEFRFRLQEGCSCCGVKLDMDDAHDFGQINSLHWSDRTTWFCDDCYNSSEGDWVRWCFPDELEKAS